MYVFMQFLSTRFAYTGLTRGRVEYILKDDTGNWYECKVIWSDNYGKEVIYLSRGWHKFLTEYGVKPRDVLRIGVPSVDRGIIYIKKVI